LYDGTLSTAFDIPDAVRRKLHRQIVRRHPQRARELEQIAERTGGLRPRDFWPQMQILAVWTGGSVGAYLPRLKEWYGEVAFRDHGLSASEGRITIPFRDGTSAGVLFIPEEEHEQPNPTILEADELIEGRNYFVLLTTSSGFYRYDIHDVVRCVGFEGTAPVLEFLNKGANFSSVTGEKLSENQVIAAVTHGFAASGIAIEQFTMAPQWGDPPGYLLLVEQGTDRSRHAELVRRIDERLGELNCEYANRLETGRLKPLAVHELAPGAWAAYRAARISRLGGSLEQYKHPALSGKLEFVDNLLGRQSQTSLASA
jgi:hypothetical protein